MHQSILERASNAGGGEGGGEGGGAGLAGYYIWMQQRLEPVSQFNIPANNGAAGLSQH